MLAPRRPGAKGLFAQIAARGELQEGFDARSRQGHHASRQIALGGARRCGVEQRVRQARFVLRRLQGQPIVALVGQHVLTETRAEAGEPLVDRREARPGLRRQRRAVAHEGGVIEREHARLLRIEPEAFARRAQRLDAGEQRLVEVDFAAGARQNRRDIAFDRLQRVVAVRARQIEKHRGDAIERRPAALQRLDRVGEGGRFRIDGDRGDFRALFGQRGVERRTEMLGLNRSERRRREWAGPGGEERVGWADVWLARMTDNPGRRCRHFGRRLRV